MKAHTLVLLLLVTVALAVAESRYDSPLDPFGESPLEIDPDEEAEKKLMFVLSTRENPDDPVMVSTPFDRESLALFNPSRPTKIIVHGWHSSSARPNIKALKKAFLDTSDVNVIMVNWHSFDTLYYPGAVKRLRPVARQLASFIDYLVNSMGLQLADLHVLGHSLGAHISGLTSLFLQNKPLARITGLDPAGPLIKGDPLYSLDKSHAAFVDVIHTCANVFGRKLPLGHVDFYPNGGKCIQPGCALQDMTTGKCSHNRSFYLFRETILANNSLLAVPSKAYDEWPCEEADMEGAKVAMGIATPESARGVYCLTTRGSEPFGYGEDMPPVTATEPSRLSKLVEDLIFSQLFVM